ncbi:OprD family porin [Pseudomonas panipatensis]|uniref:Imipenem/basic amino acid-specific outer membrane pore n=1 Tax=Pseudomonas panipatensis TaxID=428992 RepID=A0A1G8MPF1_9PSED|nr:OprD family porin [Pseudomonas panipatensis]SDI69794.1 imipenem/basic amino acid-specific outer membrane pore [Pseudomonas panipatensis]SMP77685.1 imipenem/basic amino acid-specific outer membrane pore [Pseudomonas panipatensis]
MRYSSKPFNCSALALSVALGLPGLALASEQSDAKGFVEDSSLNLLSRNLFWQQTGPGSHQRDWSQAELLDYSSGFTQGTVGFGVDAFGYLALKLDGGSGRIGSPNVPYDHNGDPASNYGKAGADVKIRVSNTTLAYGDMRPTAPVFATADNYLMPQTATGFHLGSQEIDGLDLDAGRFTSATGTTSTHHDGDLLTSYGGVSSSAASYAGGKYTFNKQFNASLYADRLQDIWDQYYLNLNYTQPLADQQSLGLDFNLYRTQDSGSAKAGTIDTTAYSLAVAYILGAHTFTLAGQKVHGDQPFDYMGFGSMDAGVAAGRYGNSINLADSVQYSDFNGPGERSWQVRYDLDLASYGVPGLSFMVRHIRGEGIDGTHLASDSAYYGLYGANDREHETDAEAKYVVQSGPAKNLSFRLRQAWHAGDASTGGHLEQTRLITEYPLNIF